MRGTLWVTLGLIVTTAWGCREEDDNPVNVLKFDTVRYHLYLWFTSATPDLTEGNHTIISPKEVNGPFKAGLALPGEIMRGLSQDVDAGTATYRAYTILKGNVQINKIGNIYSIQFSGESVSNEENLPTYFSYTGKVSYDVAH